jgi:thymidine phosphorylase
MLPQEVIRQKRDGRALTAAQIGDFVRAIPGGKVSEGQVAAFCMAVLLRGMSMDERIALTDAMAKSGTVMTWDLPGPVLDKHSTGGIGDKVSLMLAPIVAACGGYVPMLSGRGLGHTGGTLDKMDSIPGYVSQPDRELFKRVVSDVGCAIIGATPDLAPADRIMYAVRDVTGTVESIDLITTSILSKKLAAGLDALVMDVKFGTGAFMQDYKDAKALADSIVTVANGAGMKTTGLMTDMNQPLGTTAGNALEVAEAVAYLTSPNRESRLHAVTVALTAELLVLGKLAKNTAAAEKMIDAALDSGKAAEYFARMASALGGPKDFVEQPQKYLGSAAVLRDIYPERSGRLTRVDARAIGIAIVEIGGGRAKPSDAIDHAVGLTRIAPLGAEVGQGALPLATVHARNETDADRMVLSLRKACRLDGAFDAAPVIRERIG